MATRFKLQNMLEDIMASFGVQDDDCFHHVYFQPPMSVKMQYPCIKYERSSTNKLPADNLSYIRHPRYTLTFISRDPDDPIVDAIANLPKCSHDRYYAADNLNHDVFSLYF